MNNYIKFFSSIWITLFIWFFWSIFTKNSISNWYINLNKPFFNPPNWIFWPVWTFLYILIWISFYIIWKKWFWKNKKNLIKIYFLQLFLNFTWSFSFFYLENPLLWLINIILLLISIIFNIKIFYKSSKISAYLLLPYLFWVIFASILNFYIYILN